MNFFIGLVAGLIIGFVGFLLKGPISAWLATRAASKAVTAAQTLVANAVAAEKALAAAKALVAKSAMPTPPPNPLAPSGTTGAHP